MTNVRKLPAQDPRMETGPTKFGDDWSGVFIRGDHAFNYMIHLETLLATHNAIDPITRAVVVGLVETLRSCNENIHEPS